MFAVIKTGGKQYKVAENDVIIVERLLAEEGATIELDNVLMLGESGKAAKTASADLVKAAVFAEVLEQSRADKIIIFKKKRRHNYRRKAGHRQDQTVLRITGISATGTKPKAAAKKAAPAKEADKAAGAKPEAKAKAPAKKKTKE
jgi:large subunit ribosomal protein L21